MCRVLKFLRKQEKGFMGAILGLDPVWIICGCVLLCFSLVVVYHLGTTTEVCMQVIEVGPCTSKQCRVVVEGGRRLTVLNPRMVGDKVCERVGNDELERWEEGSRP